jgi:hypothetical protein
MFVPFLHSVQHMVGISLFWSFGSTCNFSIQFIPVVFHLDTSNYIYFCEAYTTPLTCPRWILPNKLTLLQNLTYPIINLKGYINYLTSANKLEDHNFFGPLCYSVIETHESWPFSFFNAIFIKVVWCFSPWHSIWAVFFRGWVKF